ncbi:NEDD4-binding protein 2-like [Dermacentor albipictus]|uniref:NEDD4-binding protein 2-like n=1 Tax=Dermacentor albipictus TaxID=60249 RepID=UPI0031FCF2DE
MPRKKRVLQRSAGDAAASTSGLYRPDEFQALGDAIMPDGIIRNNFAIGEDIHPAECLRNIQEMFEGKLDADVIHMVLTECEFNVNNALEALFTLLPQDSSASAASIVQPTQPSNLSSSSSSESIGAGENIVTSEAEVHKSSEESEHESSLAVDLNARASSDLALYVNAPPFVPNLCPSATTETQRADVLEEQASLPPLMWSQLTGPGCQLGFNITPSLSHNKPKVLSASAKELQKIRSLVDSGQCVLVLMRGLPGSGKTTLAQKICGRGVVLSADHFFCQGGRYNFDKSRLSEAHEWNKRRARKFIQEGRSPIIIDNTNVEMWEMMPYVALALRATYHVCVLEPDTPWKFDSRELTQKNMHGVPKRTIDSMLERYDRNITGESLCQSFGLFPKSSNLSVLPSCTPLEIEETSVSDSSNLLDKTLLEPPLEAPQNPSTSSSEKTSTAAPEETISLGDLIALVQNDSEESGSRSRQNSDSWSSGHDGNDSEDGTERDDDFLWASRRAPAQADVAVNETILEESDASEQENGTRLETELEEVKTEPESGAMLVEAVTEAWPDIIESKESVDDTPKPPRESPRHHGGSTRVDNTPVIEKLADFTVPWEDLPEGETQGPVTKTPKEQRSQKGKGSPKRSSEKKADSSPEKEAPHTVPKVAETSKQKHFSVRGPIFGLEKVVRSSTWTFPEFSVFESTQPETEVKNSAHIYKDASSYTDPTDFTVVGKVLLGESDELRVVEPRDPAERLDQEHIHLAPAYKANTLARSTDTDDLPTDDLDDEGKLLLLQQCMPGVRPPDLEDIFQHCHRDHVWAADLLLDSDVSCDLQPLVISEDCDAADTTGGLKSANQQPEVHTSVVPAENERKCAESSADTMPADNRLKKSSLKTFLPKPASVDREFTFQLDHSFACQLVETFGCEGLHVSIDAFRSVDLNVTLTSEIARQLHQLWMDTLKQRMSKEEEEMLEMVADSHENEPQHLQMGGEGCSKENVPEIPGIPPPALHDDPRWNKAPHEMSFREIMEMEAALEEKRKDWTKNNTYMDMATKLKLKQLYEKFPGVDRQALDEIFVASNYSLIQSVLTINETLGVTSEEEDMENYEKQIVDLVGMESMREDEADDNTWQPVVEGHEDMYDRLRLVGDYDVIRREATVHYHMRQESFRKAKEAYHRGMKTVAAFYSQQGRAYAEKMREANERASWKLLQLSNAQCDDNTLDLHGLHVQEAIQVLKNYVKLKKRESWCLQKKQTLRVITGRGAHSALNIPKVKFAVEGYLLSSQLNYREVQAGMFHVML